MVSGISSFALRHRLSVLIFWGLILASGIYSGSHLQDRLTTTVQIPGSESDQANQILAKEFDENFEGMFTVIYKFKNSTVAEVETMKAQIAQAAQVIPQARVSSSRAIAGYLFASVQTSMDLTDSSLYTERLRDQLKAVGLVGSLVSGPPAIKSDVSPILDGDLRTGELLGGGFALALLILFLGFSRTVFIPFLFAAATISLSVSAIYLLSYVTTMVIYLPNLIALIGLGLAIDYSLLMIARYSKQRRAGDNHQSALATSYRTSGKTVVVSGLIVSGALLALLVIPIPFIRSLGIGAVTIPIASVLAALTLQPVLIDIFGKGSSVEKTGIMDRSAISFATRAANISIKSPKKVFVLSITALLPIAFLSIWVSVTPSSLTALPASLESSRALSLVTSNAGEGVITPHVLIVDLQEVGAASTVGSARDALVAKLSAADGVIAVASDSGGSYLSENGRFLKLYAVTSYGLGTSEDQDRVRDLRAINLSEFGFDTSARLIVGGAPAQGFDLLATLSTHVPWTVALMVLIVFIALFFAFKSMVLPLKAIALDALSILVACGALVIFTQLGLGQKIFGMYHLDQIEAWSLLLIAVVLFGLSMDYEVFIVSRIIEARREGASDEEAIRIGIRETASIVSAAALILIAALSGLILGHFAGLQEIGIGLAVGIAVDVTIIRIFLLPSAMVLLGNWNWWLPHILNKRESLLTYFHK
jgi:RND superfamily putative drug exporter